MTIPREPTRKSIPRQIVRRDYHLMVHAAPSVIIRATNCSTMKRKRPLSKRLFRPSAPTQLPLCFKHIHSRWLLLLICASTSMLQNAFRESKSFPLLVESFVPTSPFYRRDPAYSHASQVLLRLSSSDIGQPDNISMDTISSPIMHRNVTNPATSVRVSTATGSHISSSVPTCDIDDATSSSGYRFWESQLSIQSFNMDLHNLAIENPRKAQDALEIMEQIYEQQEQLGNQTLVAVKPNSASYTTVIEGWCSYSGGSGTERHNDNRSTVSTTASLFSSTPSLDCSLQETAERAQVLLDRMEGCDHLQPNELTYLLVCQKWAETNFLSGANAQRANDVLNQAQRYEMDRTEEGSLPPIINSAKLYSIVCEAWCRRVGKVPHAMEHVEALLQQMEGSLEANPRPNIVTYTNAIGALARSQAPQLGTRALNMLDRMRGQAIEPDMVAYTSVLNCWAKTRDREERTRSHCVAKALLEEMETAYIHEEKYHVKPNAITYATAIKAIGNSLGAIQEGTAPHKLAEEVLVRMRNLTATGTLHVPPTAGTYNAAIATLSSSSAAAASYSKSTKLSMTKRAEHLLVDMIKRTRAGESAVEPNVRTWGAVLRAWAESGQPDAGEQAQRVLCQMQVWYQQGKSAAKPNVVCYTTVMNAYARSSNVPTNVVLARVEELLLEMERVYSETMDVDIRPNKITYVTAIDAFCRKAKGHEAAEKAQATVDRMMRLYSLDKGYARPTRIVFNALINAYSKSSHPDAASNAERVFRWMESQYRNHRDESVRPDEITLCAVLNAWANHAQNGGAARAQQILEHIESLSSEERGFPKSIVCHNILIKAWGRSRAPDSVQQAEAILNNLEKGASDFQQGSNPLRPDVTTYSSVINCCAYYVGDAECRKEAFDVAMRTFERFHKQRTPLSEGPNNITYGTIFKAIGKLTSVGPTRNDIIEKLFLQCTQEGQVDLFVLSQVRGATRAKLFKKLVLLPCKLDDKDEKSLIQILEKMPEKWGDNIVAWGH